MKLHQHKHDIQGKMSSTHIKNDVQPFFFRGFLGINMEEPNQNSSQVMQPITLLVIQTLPQHHKSNKSKKLYSKTLMTLL